MASREKLEDLNITQEELHKLTEALKQDEFKKLFFDYAEEISNPENRARYESEIQQLENERGMDIKFINPEPGYVIKTTVGGEMKAFVNVCKNENVGKPSSAKKIGNDGRPGLSWTLPHSFAPPREDVDREKKKCRVFDFVVHPDTYRMAETNLRFKKMINNLALEGIRKQFDVEPDTKNVKFPKLKYKGTPTPTVIRSRLPGGSQAAKDPSDIMSQFPYPYDNQTSEEKAKQNEAEYSEKQMKKEKSLEKKEVRQQKETKKQHETEDEFTVPKYTITHRSEIDFQDYASVPDIKRSSTHPKALVVHIFLPLLSSAAPVQLDIFEHQLKLLSTKPAKYKLDIALPYAVDENEGSAKFDKAQRKLMITLPVVPATTNSVLLPPENGSSDGSNDHSSMGVDAMDNRADADLDMKLSDEPLIQPLIQEISSSYTGAPESDNKLLTTSENEAFSCQNTEVHQENELTTEANVQNVFSVSYVLPYFECNQTSQNVNFVFHVFKVCRENISLVLLSEKTFQVQMVSVGDGGFPIHYCCYLSFEDNCNIVTTESQLDVKKDQVVLSLFKDHASIGWWDTYFVGTDASSLVTCQFTTCTEECDTQQTSSVTTEQLHCSVQMQEDEPDEHKSVVSDNGGVTYHEDEYIATSRNDADTLGDKVCSNFSADSRNSSSGNGTPCQPYKASTAVCNGNAESDSVTSSGSEVQLTPSDADIKVQQIADSNLSAANSTLDSSMKLNHEDDLESSITELSSRDVVYGAVNTETGMASLSQSKPLIEEISDGEAGQKSNKATDSSNNGTVPHQPSSMLSWSEAPHDNATSKTTCAVQFENSVMFDLDVD